MKQKVIATYESTPYTSRAFKASSPLRLEAISALFGFKSKELGGCRVLELGCSFGANIIYAALNAPSAEFVGIDISPVHIQKAQKIAKDIGAKNLEFLEADICEIIADEKALKSLGKFDYIIAHGLYSWVDDRVKDALFMLISKTLSQNGLAYVSFNAYPGWKQRDILRDLMLFSTSHLERDDERLSRAKSVLKALLGYANSFDENSEQRAVFSKAFLEHAKDICELYDDFYLMHEHFELSNDPKYLSQFVTHASKFDLAYLLDSSLSASFFDARNQVLLRPSLSERIKAEQYSDFLSMRCFRAAILSHSKLAKARESALLGRLENLELKSVYYRGDFDIARHEITAKNGSVVLNTSAKALAQALNNFYPSFASISELADAINTEPKSICALLLQLVFIGAVEISAKKLEFPAYEKGKTRLKESLRGYLEYFATTSKPKISLAGYMGEILSLEPYEAHLALLFDGKRDIKELCDDFISYLEKNNIDLKDEQKGLFGLRKDYDFMLNYTKQIAKTLQNSGFFEKIE